MTASATPRLLTLALFTNLDPTSPTFVDCPLKELSECSRHQLVIFTKPDPPSAGSVAVRGIQAQSKLGPAHFDSRLDAINMHTGGSQIFNFYGLFDGLRFDFSSFPAGVKLSAALISHQDELLISGNAP